MYAAQYGETETVKILLEHGADINTKDDTGQIHILLDYIPIYVSIIKLKKCFSNKLFNSYLTLLNRSPYQVMP